MRELTYPEKRWVENLHQYLHQPKLQIAEWLEKSFLKAQEGRALIIQAKESYAIYFLRRDIFSDEEKKQQEIKAFLDLVTFLGFLRREGYISITRGQTTRSESMFFLQDEFLAPKPANGPIVLNTEGDYTERPDAIHDRNKNVIYEGIRLEQDHFDLLMSTCTGSLVVSDTIVKLLEPPKEAEPPPPPVTNHTHYVHKNISIKQMVTLVSIGVAIVLIIGIFMHHSLTKHYQAAQDAKSAQATLLTKVSQLEKKLSNLPGQHDLQASKTFYGIDISRWNGNLIEEITDKQGLTFAFCKATQGDHYVDPDFYRNWEVIKAKGLYRGAYHFYDTDKDPIDQATHFTKTLGQLGQKDISPVLDIEPGSFSKNKQVDPMQLQVDLLVFLHHVASITGRKPIIYADPSFANQYLLNRKFGDYPLWVAEYTNAASPTIPKTWEGKGYKFWQKSESYAIDSDKVDYDVFNGVEEEIFD